MLSRITLLPTSSSALCWVINDCLQAALSEAGHPYTELNVGLDTSLRAAVREVAGKTSVPQVGQTGIDQPLCTQVINLAANGLPTHESSDDIHIGINQRVKGVLCCKTASA
jgi:hypothetical protein